MWRDPLTLIIAVGKDGSSAKGNVYLDDGDSYAYRSGEFVWREFRLETTTGGKVKTRISSHVQTRHKGRDHQVPFGSEEEEKGLATASEWSKGIKTVRIEQIVVLGMAKQPSSVSVITQGGKGKEAEEVEWEWYEGKAATSTKPGGLASKLVLKIPPGVGIVHGWEIDIV